MQGYLHQSGEPRELALSSEQGCPQQLHVDMPERWPDTSRCPLIQGLNNG